MRYVPRLDVVDTPVGRGRPPTLRRSLLDARGRSPGCRSRKRLGTRLRAPLLLKSSIITSSPPLAGMLSLVLRRSAGRVRGSLLAVAAARRCCFRASASSSRAGVARTRLPGSVRSGGRPAAVTPVFVHRQPSPTVCACPVTPYSAVRDVQDLRPRAGAAPRRGTGSRAAPRRRGCCFCLLRRYRCPLCHFSFPAIEDLLEGTNPTSRRVQRPRPPARQHSSQLLVVRRQW